MITNNIKKGLGMAVTFFMLSLVSYAFICSKNEKTKINHSYTDAFFVDWYADGYGKIEFPFSFDAKAGETVHLYGTLPANISQNSGFMFQSLYCKSEVYVDGVKVFSYGGRQPLNVGKMTGNIRLICPLQPHYKGRPIDVYITPYYNQHTDLSGFTYGNMDALKLKVLQENIFRFCMVITLLTMMIFGLVLTLYQLNDPKRANLKMFKYFTLLVLLTSLWLICSSDLPQYMTNANEAISLISFLCLACIGIPYMGFCGEVLKTGQKLFSVMQIAGYALPLINMTGFCLRLFDPLEVLILSHLYIAVATVLSLIYGIRNFRDGIESKLLLLGVVIVLLSAGAGMVFFYIAPSQSYAGTIVGIGMMAFVATLFALVLYRQIFYIREKKDNESYQKLAFTDVPTRLRNRVGFDRFFDEMNKEKMMGMEFFLYLFDIDDLKRINVEMGHEEGDSYVLGTADCLDKTFGNTGDVFRLGSDEFAAVILGAKKVPEKIMHEFEANIEYYNSVNKKNLSVSKAWCKRTYTGQKNFRQELYRMADEALIIDKQRKYMKHQEEL